LLGGAVGADGVKNQPDLQFPDPFHGKILNYLFSLRLARPVRQDHLESHFPGGHKALGQGALLR
jgi:hypothetical protein